MTLLWLSLRARWRNARGRAVALAALTAVLGGFVLAAASAARHVGDAYETLIDDVGAPDLLLGPSCERLDTGFGCEEPTEGSSAESSLQAQLAAISVVTQVRPATVVTPYFIDANGRPLLATADDPYGCFDDDRSVALIATLPGDRLAQSIPFRLTGELPQPGSNGIVLTRATMDRVSLAIGDTVRLAGWCTGDGDPAELGRAVDLTITGRSIGPLDVEPPGTGLALEPAYVDATLIEQLLAAGVESQHGAMVWVDRSVSATAIEDALNEYTLVIDFDERRQQFDDALTTDAELLWLLAGVGFLGLVLVVSPLVGTVVRQSGRTTPTMLALGATHGQVAAHAAAHVATIGAAAGVGAAILSVPFATLMPRGLAVEIVPGRHLWLDPVVTVAGMALVMIVVAGIGAVAGWRLTARDLRVRQHRPTRLGHALDGLRLRPAARSGVLSAVGAPIGPHQASPWPALMSLTIAVTALTASATYLAGLQHLEQTPSLVGWNWDAAVSFDGADAESRRLAFGDVDALAGVDQAFAGTMYPPVMPTVIGTDIGVWPWSFATGPGAITPTMLEGRAPDGPDEIAISEVLMRQTNLTVGDAISLTRPTLVTRLAQEFEHWALESGLDPGSFGVVMPDEQLVERSFEITGIAVLPLQRTQQLAQGSFTLGGLGEFIEPSASEMSEARAWLPTDLPDDLVDAVELFFTDLDIATRSAYMRFNGDPRSTVAAIEAVDGVESVAAPTPDEVISIGVGLNLAHTDRIPRALAIMVSIASVLILAFMLPASIRMRRHELAVMRSVGLTGRGVRSSAAWQATTTAITPMLVAVPLGIAIGRAAWTAYARDLEVLPEAVIPWAAIAAAAVGMVVVANVSAVIPGRSAARRVLATDLRAG